MNFRDKLEQSLYDFLQEGKSKEQQHELAQIISDSSDNDLAMLAFIHEVRIR